MATPAHTEPTSLTVAPSWRRLCAALVDGLPLCALALALAWHHAPQLPVRWNLWDHGVDLFWADPRAFWMPLAGFGGASVLLPVIWALLRWRSPGQWLLRLRSVNRTVVRISAIHALGHAIARVILTALFGVGPLWALVDPDRRTLYDRLARVYVALEASRKSLSARTVPGEVETPDGALL